MKRKILICMFLCTALLCAAVFATENGAADSQSTAEQTMPAPPAEGQAEGQMSRGGPGGMRGGGRGMRPDMQQNTEAVQQGDDAAAANGEGQMPQEGQVPPEGFGGGRGGMNGNTQMPSQQNQAETTQDFTVNKTDRITYIASAVLLVLGFLFVIFYKRRTF